MIDNFWFYFWLVEKVVRDFLKQSESEVKQSKHNITVDSQLKTALKLQYVSYKDYPDYLVYLPLFVGTILAIQTIWIIQPIQTIQVIQTI